jgi:superfamily II DNA or RNA helicase
LLQAELEKKIGAEFVRILFSEHDSKERDATFQWLKDTPGSVLISPLVKEGVSIPELTAGVVADYVGTIDVARQIIGRFIRKKRHRDENTATIVWFADRQVPSYRRGSMEVLRDLESIRGYKFVHPVQGPETRDLGMQYDAR